VHDPELEQRQQQESIAVVVAGVPVSYWDILVLAYTGKYYTYYCRNIDWRVLVVELG